MRLGTPARITGSTVVTFVAALGCLRESSDGARVGAGGTSAGGAGTVGTGGVERNQTDGATGSVSDGAMVVVAECPTTTAVLGVCTTHCTHQLFSLAGCCLPSGLCGERIDPFSPNVTAAFPGCYPYPSTDPYPTWAGVFPGLTPLPPQQACVYASGADSGTDGATLTDASVPSESGASRDSSAPDAASADGPG